MRYALAALVVLLVAPVARPEPATRGDVALSFLRFEQAYRRHPPAAEDRPAVNREFDRKSLAVFRGGFAGLARAFDEMAAGLRPEAENGPHRRAAESLRVRMTPRVCPVGTAATARIVSLYAVRRPEGEVRLVLRLRHAGGEPRDIPFVLPPPPVDLRLDLPAAKEAGTRTMEIVLPDGTAMEAGRWFVSSRPLDSIRSDLELRRAALDVADAALADAAATVKDRLSLLRDPIDESRTIQILTDPLALAADLDRELEILADGRDPLRGRPGHLWRRLRVGRIAIPMRVHVPTAVREGRPLPVVIALHGAAADENMFPEAYGAGRIAELSESRGFVLVSPATGPFQISPRTIGILLDTLELHLPVDRTRVYLVGHSMGAMASVGLAQRHVGRLAAVCAIAGGGRIVSDSMAPTLFVSGEHDRIVSTAGVRRSFLAFEEAGRPVEFRLAEGYGHTLLVGDVLPDVVTWLLEHRLGAGTGSETRRVR